MNPMRKIEEQFVEEAERKLDTRFPPVYRSRLLRNNGGTIEDYANVMDWEVYPVFDRTDRKSMGRTVEHVVMMTQKARQLTGFPEHGVAIAACIGRQMILLPKQDDPEQLDETVYIFWEYNSALQRYADHIDEIESKYKDESAAEELKKEPLRYLVERTEEIVKIPEPSEKEWDMLWKGDDEQLDEFTEQFGIIVDWKEFDDEIVKMVAACLDEDTMSVELTEDQLLVTYNGEFYPIHLSLSWKDRYITIRGLNGILQDKYEIRTFRPYMDSDTHALFVRKHSWWKEMERQYPEKIRELFAVIDETVDFT